MVLCENDFSVSLDPYGTVTLNPVNINEGSYAICGNIIDMTVSPAVLTCADVGATEVTLTVTTDNGQTASCYADIEVSPWIGELCDGIDNNCNGIIDDSPIDQDEDTYNICEDCDDTDPSVHPGALEICDGIDNNCNGEIDEDGLMASLLEKLTTGDVSGLGFSVAIDGDWAIVGNFNADPNNATVQGVYPYHLEGNSWVQKQPLLPNDGPTGSNTLFGISVAISGDWAIVGAFLFNTSENGEAYMFRLNGENWEQIGPKLTAYDANEPISNHFGWSVAISGEKVIVGASNGSYFNESFVKSAGSAYFFHWDGDSWVPQMPKATAPSPQSTGYFGTSVSISGDWAIVGSHSEGNNNAGAAYFFHWNGTDWGSPPERVAPDDAPTPGENFGISVALHEDRAIVGSSGEAAYLFHKNGNNWGPQLAKLTASAGQNGDNFGSSVSISGDIALVGAPGYMEDAGAVYPYHWNGTAWMELPKITAEDYLAGDSESGDIFGQSVCADQDRIIVGALGDNEWAGAAYLSAIVPCGPMRPASAAISLSAKAKTTFTLYPNPALVLRALNTGI